MPAAEARRQEQRSTGDRQRVDRTRTEPGAVANLRRLDLNIPAAKTASHTVLLRADAWVLPFLNVYGMLGYTNGQTEPRCCSAAIGN